MSINVFVMRLTQNKISSFYTNFWYPQMIFLFPNFLDFLGAFCGIYEQYKGFFVENRKQNENKGSQISWDISFKYYPINY